MDLARKFAREGIAVASVGHRLSPGTWADPNKTAGVKHPAHVQDIAVAFKWLYEHGKEYGYDPDNIFIGGFSSGAHLAALIGSDKRYLEKHGLSLEHIKGLIPVAGAYNISAYHQTFLTNEDSRTRAMADSHVKAVFGNTEADFEDASPTSYMEHLSIPMLLVSEGALFNYTKIYEERIWESDFRNCQIYHVFDLDHGGLWKNLSFEKNSQHRNLMVQFIKQQADKPGLANQ
jgi:acetyl esterase/lipase